MDGKSSIDELIKYGINDLTGVSDLPGMHARVLLSFVLSSTHEWIAAHPEEGVSEDQVRLYTSFLDRLKKREPLPYITGRQDFYGLPFFVTREVLIPRPETELLVETAIDWTNAHFSTKKILDVGTGSGCIAITLAKMLPQVEILATDRSDQALLVAMENAVTHHVSDRIRFVKTDLLEGIEEQFDCVTANLPYIPTNRLTELSVFHWEPALALDGGHDGFTVINRLLENCSKNLMEQFIVLVEIDHTHAELARKAAAMYFPLSTASVVNDLRGQPRLLIVKTEALS